jgi:predicted amidohydrolase
VSPEELREVAALRVAKALFVPMSMIDGRPWVPTAAEADAFEHQQSEEN